MSINHRISRVVFGLVVGLIVAMLAYNWITNPEPRAARAEEERVVGVARTWLSRIVGTDAVEIVDPLAQNRRVGKTYVFREAPGWAVSGFYRRNEQDDWHPYLMTLDEALEVAELKVQDPLLRDRAQADPRLVVVPD